MAFKKFCAGKMAIVLFLVLACVGLFLTVGLDRYETETADRVMAPSEAWAFCPRMRFGIAEGFTAL